MDTKKTHARLTSNKITLILDFLDRKSKKIEMSFVNKSFFIVFIILIQILIGCKNEVLSKETAIELLKTHKVVDDCYFRFTTNTKSDWKSYKSDLKIFNELVELKLMKPGKTYRTRASIILPYYTTHEYLPTSKAIDEYNYKKTNSGFGGSKANALFSKATVSDIIGITQSDDNNIATALVLLEYKETPFAKLKGDRHKPNQCHSKSTFEIEVEFVKYDTGWRIKNQ